MCNAQWLDRLGNSHYKGGSMSTSKNRMSPRPSLAIVIPVYNEAAGLSANLGAILDATGLLDAEVRLLVVNDGSHDDTVTVLQHLCRSRPQVSYLSLTRNFGKESAILAGLRHAAGDAVVVMDGDLQHPPALIAQMVECWRKGAGVVEAVKVDRGGESWLATAFARSFYAIFKRTTDLDITHHSDFKLLDRAVVEAYLALPEKQRFFRGLIGWLGFPTVRIPFEVPPRPHGRSGWSRPKLVRYAVDALTMFTAAPLHLITAMGTLTLALCLTIAVIALYHKLSGQALGGFTTVILLLTFIGSVMMLGLGIVGNYIARIYDELKGRPSYLVDWQHSRLPERDQHAR
jgi:glycosyltransferase involved in cell wall biosynthesis